MLTQKQMHAAHFCRQLELDPDLADIPDPLERAAAWAKAHNFDPTYYRAKMRLGLDILRNYSLAYTERYNGNDNPPPIPRDVIQHMCVPAGYIKGEYVDEIFHQLALFRIRRQH